ncbi:MAG: aminoglycoside 6'-N-acetyltransferase I [Planctomycetota bacterium]|jgi:aminoglycoside 6'-N-acetyltransferase I
MNIELKLCDESDAHIIKNLWPLYVHDVSEFDAVTPNAHGLLLDDDKHKILADQCDTLRPWFNEPEALFPYLILVDGKPAGFNLVAARSRIDDSIDADFVVHEFFLLHAFRGGGVALEAVKQGFALHPGSWEVVTYPSHSRAIAFWMKATKGGGSDEVNGLEADHAFGRKVVFRFDTRS